MQGFEPPTIEATNPDLWRDHLDAGHGRQHAPSCGQTAPSVAGGEDMTAKAPAASRQRTTPVDPATSETLPSPEPDFRFWVKLLNGRMVQVSCRKDDTIQHAIWAAAELATAPGGTMRKTTEGVMGMKGIFDATHAQNPETSRTRPNNCGTSRSTTRRLRARSQTSRRSSFSQPRDYRLGGAKRPTRLLLRRTTQTSRRRPGRLTGCLRRGTTVGA